MAGSTVYLLNKAVFPIRHHSPILTLVLQGAEVLWTVSLCTHMVFRCVPPGYLLFYRSVSISCYSAFVRAHAQI